MHFISLCCSYIIQIQTVRTSINIIWNFLAYFSTWCMCVACYQNFLIYTFLPFAPWRKDIDAYFRAEIIFLEQALIWEKSVNYLSNCYCVIHWYYRPSKSIYLSCLVVFYFSSENITWRIRYFDCLPDSVIFISSVALWISGDRLIVNL
jgi:hypothetical protein